MTKVMEIIDAIMALSPDDRRKVIGAVHALDDTLLSPPGVKSFTTVGTVQEGSAMMPAATDQMPAQSIEDWYAENCANLNTRERYRLLVQSLEGCEGQSDKDFISSKLEQIRSDNKMFALEMAFTDFAYQRPFWALLGIVGLLFAIWKGISGGGRALFHLMF